MIRSSLNSEKFEEKIIKKKIIVAKHREQKMQTRFVSPIHKKNLKLNTKHFFLLLFTNSQKEYIYIYF